MPKETFSGLDNLILDQPEFIDINDKDISGTDDADKNAEADKLALAEKEKSDLAAKKAAEKKDDNLIDVDNDDNTNKDDEAEKKKKELEASADATQTEQLKGWGEYFKDKTILSEEDLEGFDGTVEGLTEAFQKREYRVGLEMVDDYKSQLPEVLKFLHDNWEDGVPLTELLNIKSNQIRFSNVTDEKLEESVDTQKAIYAEYLRKTTKFSDTKIEKEIAKLVDLDELKDESKESLKELKKFEAEAEDTLKKETKKQREDRLEENKKTIKLYEKFAKDTKEVIPGIKIDEKLQEKVLKNVINPVGLDGNGNPVSYIQTIRNVDPIGFDYRLNYFIEITKGLTDFSKIGSASKTAAVKDLSKILETPAPKDKKDAIDTTGKKSVLDYLAMPQNKR